MPMQWQTIQLSLGGGVETGTDVRAADPRQMDVANDVQFDELRGAQTRKPITSGAFGSNNIFGGGTLSNCRRIETVNGELVLFTDVGVYSWNAQQSAWVLRGTHLAVSVTETPRFVSTGDQIDGDRAELNGTIVYAWTEGSQVYAAAIDKATGSVLVQPTAVTSSTARPRLVALATAILLFSLATSSFVVRAINPANPATGIASAATVINVAAGGPYDVVKVDGQDLCAGAWQRSVTTSYNVFTITPALATNIQTVVLTCDGPIAVATTPGAGAQIQVIRGNGTNVQGDLFTTSTLAVVFSGQAIGTASGTINQIAVAFVASLATVFWSCSESADGTTTGFATKKNTVTTANVVGTQSVFVLTIGVGSRAFEHGGRVYVWLAFGCESAASGFGVAVGVRAQLQNTYFLYRDDGLLVSKATFDVGGGFSPSRGHLPGISAITSNDYAWLSGFRRIIDLGGSGHTGFEARSPREIAFSFDSNAARRSVQLGRTLYIGGGLLTAYDGATLAEVGFAIYPFTFFVATSAGGALAAGSYAYKSTLRWQNAQGEQERSTTAAGFLATVPASGLVTINAYSLKVTLKTATRIAPAVELWRSAVSPTADAPFFLVTSKDPGAVGGSNAYIANDPTSLTVGGAFTDNFPDATLTTKETNPENGAVLESLAPPGASIIRATDTRIFVAGVAGDPDSVWYSRLRGVGEIASFHDGNAAPVPPDGGDITAIAFLNETLVVFRETAIYALPGQGFDNTGGGQNFGPSNRLSSDCGAISAETVALTPMGLVFKSRKGWYLLDRGWGVRYIGSQVAKFDGDTINAIHIVETQHQVRILTSARMLVWDYNATTDAAPIGQWAVWTISDGVHATMWNGSYVYLTATGPKIEQATYTGVTYGADVESSWIKLNDLQGAGRVGQIEILGEYRSACLVRVRVARDYQYDGAGNVVYYDDKAWPPSPTVVGSALQVRHSPTQGQCEAIKVRITAVAAGVRASLSTAGMSGGVPTSGSNWSATFAVWDTVFAGKAFNPGEMGNAITMSLSFELAAAVLIDVRDHFRYDISLGRWREDVGNVGVRITGPNAGIGITVNDLEGAIAAATALVQVALGDPVTTKTLSMNVLNGQVVTGAFTGGTYVAPAGEALKLTGLGLEVGIKPGLYRRLAAAQKQ